MENESELRSPMCRLCLRVYSNEQLVQIFGNNTSDDKTIYAAVSVLPLPGDPSNRICVHCRNLIAIITTFKAACLQSDLLLKNSSYELQSDAWQILSEIDIFQQAVALVQRHQQDIDAVSKRCALDVDARYDPVASPSQLISESVSLFSNSVDDVIEEEIKDGPQFIEIPYSDNAVEQYLEDVEDLSSDLIVFDEQTDESIEQCESENLNGIIPDSNPNEGIAPSKRRRGRVVSKMARDKREKVICSTCGELVSILALEGHQNRHLGVQPFACDFEGCQAKLHSKFALQQHRSRHKTTSRYYDCEVCGKRIKSTAYWQLHKKMHTEEPKFSCNICGKKFRRKTKLKVHSTVHSGVANFRCEICSKFFTVKHNLTAHYKLHMKNGTYPPGFQPSTTLEETKPVIQIG